MKTMAKIMLLAGVFFLFFSCRTEEEEQPKIGFIAFEIDSKTLVEGDTAKIRVIAEPAAAKIYDRIQYWASDGSLLEIMPESNNDYVVFKALKAGQGVIEAKVNGRSAYCNVKAFGSDGNIIPYIVMSDYVVETEVGSEYRIFASLVGGNIADDSDFVWTYTNQNLNVIDLIANNKEARINGKKSGETVITVSHKKAQFSVNVLVFVGDRNQAPMYISTANNVITMNLSDTAKEYAVDFHGGKTGANSNYHLFRHNIVNELNEVVVSSPVISLSYSNNIGTVAPKAKGIAKIMVSHQDADYPIEIVVIVNEVFEYRYINIEESVLILNEGEYRMITPAIAGATVEEDDFEFEFINSNPMAVEITPSRSYVGIRALQKGNAVITVSHSGVDFDKDILVIVNGQDSLVDQEKYITTNQNVITTEVNGEAVLKMSLVGGNSADANNFIWTVDDASIIDVTSAHGSVKNSARSAASTAPVNFEATAIIRALKVGATTITVENKKSSNTCKVVVKVYKQGLLGAVPVVLRGPAIYKIELGQTADVNLYVSAGLEKNFTNVRWESGGSGVFSVKDHTALSGVLKGEQQGIGTLTVAGDNLKNDYTALVVVGDEDYLASQPYIYVDNPFISVVKGQTVSFSVLSVNMGYPSADLSVVNNFGDKIEVVYYRNTITVKGLDIGEGEIVIGGEDLNDVRVVVSVEDYNITPESPYYLRPQRYIYGVVKNRSIEIPVDLVGGIARDEKDIKWELIDSKVAEIKANGKKCVITGKGEGQTVLKVSHPRSQNNIEIVIYTVLSDAELNSKVIVHVPNANILLKNGETRFISIITNANELQNDFRWSCSNLNVVDLRQNASKTSAYIDALSVGNAVVSVGYGDQAPTVIYVSVTSSLDKEPYISVPSIIEMYSGQTITINAATNEYLNKYEIKWGSLDESIAKVYGNGDACVVTAFKEGKAIIKVTAAGFSKNIALWVYKTSSDVGNAYIFAGEQSRYVINKGDIIHAGLVFGLKGYPEHDLVNIRWSTGDIATLGVTGNGKTAMIRGLSAGTGHVTVEDNYGNSVSIEVMVVGAGAAGKYTFVINSADRIKGMLPGSDEFIEVRVFNGSSEIYNVTGIEYIVENENVIWAEGSDAGVRVFAKPGAEGQSYITIRHDLAADMRMLMYTSFDLDNAFPVMTEKSNYLVNKGDSFNLYIQTVNNDPSKLANISYELEYYSSVITIQERGKKELAVSAHDVGADVILVLYNGEVAQRVYVSVMEKGYGVTPEYLVTENIIGLVVGQEYETRVDSDSNSYIEWASADDSVCEIIEKTGKTARLRAGRAGETFITVKQGSTERVILVFAVHDRGELESYDAVNIERRHYAIPKGRDITVSLACYQGELKGQTRFEDYYGHALPYGGVIEVNAQEQGKLSVKGVNEGTALIKVTNDYYASGILVYIEVFPVQEGSIGANSKEHYITAEKTLFVLGGDINQAYVQVGVVPDVFYGDDFWVWAAGDESVVVVEALGRGAVIRAVNEGQTLITVSNKDCENALEITVIVGERFTTVSGKEPYIFMEKDVFDAVKGGPSLSLQYTIANVANIDLKKIFVNVTGDCVRTTHNSTAGIVTVEPVKAGISRFDISYGALKKEAYVIVKENLNAGNIYLTTSENFVIVKTGELRAVSVNLTGYDEIDPSKIVWTVSDDSPKNVAYVSGSGLAVQVYGISEGSVTLNVRHNRNDEFRAEYPLTMHVKVVKNEEKAVYLTTQMNVIETVAGASGQFIYVQKVGGDVTKSATTFVSSNASVASISQIAGYAAYLNINGAGAAKITVRNAESVYDLEIHVMVRESAGNGVYISSQNSLIWLSPGEKNRRISVNLVNGDPKDNNRIIWDASVQIPSDPKVPTGNKVINIVSSNEQCVIDAVNVGAAQIRVECPGRADLPFTITVYVSHFKEIGFSESHKDLVKNEMEVIALNLPTYERLKDKAKVWAVGTDGVSPQDAVDVYYTNSVVVIHGVKPGNAVIRAAVEGKEGYGEMTVSVKEAHDPNVTRIVAGKNLYVLGERTGQISLNAAVTGPDIFDGDQDDLEWQIISNTYGDEKETRPILTVFPAPDRLTGKSYGEQIQITPGVLGTAVIRVSHPLMTQGCHKDIYVIVSDLGNKFNVNKTQVTINMDHQWETVAVDILGGTSRDYEEVRWVAKMQARWDGTMLEVVRLAGSGREVTLIPVSNGETEVYAFWRGEHRVVQVNCVSDYYFDVVHKNEMMYPGEVRDVPYEISPASNTVTWNYSPDDSGPVLSIAEISGSAPGGNGTVQRTLRLTAIQEGNATIIGMPKQGLPVMINVTVTYDYEFTLGNNRQYPAMAYNENNPAPRFSITNTELFLQKYGQHAKTSSTGVNVVKYTVFPENTYIKCMTPLPPGLSVEISEPEFRGYDSKRRRVGHGEITFTGTLEMNETTVFRLHRPRVPGQEETPVEQSNPSRPTERQVIARYFFPNVDLEPFFVRGEGKYSNSSTLVNAVPGIPATANGKGKYRWLRNNQFTEGETGEYLNYNSNYGGALALGDGEAHYIVFDKYYESAGVEIKGMAVDGRDIKSGGTLYSSEEGIEFKAEIVDLTIDGETYRAVRISGGDDYIRYNRVRFNQELFIGLNAMAISGYTDNKVYWYNVLRDIPVTNIRDTSGNYDIPYLYLDGAAEGFMIPYYHQSFRAWADCSWGCHHTEDNQDYEYLNITNIPISNKFYINTGAGLSMGFTRYYSKNISHKFDFVCCRTTLNSNGSSSVSRSDFSITKTASFNTYELYGNGRRVSFKRPTLSAAANESSSHRNHTNTTSRFYAHEPDETQTWTSISDTYDEEHEIYGNDASGDIENIFAHNNDGSIRFGEYGKTIWSGYHDSTHNTKFILHEIPSDMRLLLKFDKERIRFGLFSFDTNTVTIAPYYVLNRKPFRYKGRLNYGLEKQLVHINDVPGTTPMPSISRNLVKSQKVTLQVKYKIFNNDIEKNVEIPITCVIRPSHSQYTGTTSSDSSVKQYTAGNIAELEGSVKFFNNPIEEYNNDDLSNYIR